ncbi:MAG TPA: HAMP domain-containing sensor histidine kinase [Flavisolibacter sp.]|nr:HAMP domain-containing sensor histidine kinase [Flavisolibacter sp.]
MTLTILVITGFQVYWLKKSYEREERNIEMRTNMLFRETIRTLQASKLKLDHLSADSAKSTRVFIQRGGLEKRRARMGPDQKMVTMMDVLIQKANDTSNKEKGKRKEVDDTTQVFRTTLSPRQNRIIQFLYDVDSIQDSIRIKEIEIAYAARLAEQNFDLPFKISRIPTPELQPDKPVFNEVTLGFRNPITFRLEIGNTFPLIAQRLMVPILFSVFLVGFTVLSFTLLYRNLIRQQRLAELKNDFISNITHELKTPIATVSVAIEALKSFGASLNPEKSKEYLDISANELQRLSLLVDKVLKLSMFEKKEIELNYELLDMRSLVDEVTTSLRLQFDKRKTKIIIASDGDTHFNGDRLHLVSVIFNLLDNALKYSNGSPEIDIRVVGTDKDVILSVEDRGIGIPAEFHSKIFDKFFRVPMGNLHNAKGYGLGLSYVSHIVEKHKGDIKVESSEDSGTTFTIRLPKQLSNKLNSSQ